MVPGRISIFRDGIGPFKRILLGIYRVIRRGEVSQLESNSLLDHLLLSAEEKQDYGTFAPPLSMGLLEIKKPQQTKVQTLLRAQSQVISQAQPQMPQDQPEATQAQLLALGQPLLSPRRYPQAQAAPPPVKTSAQSTR